MPGVSLALSIVSQSMPESIYGISLALSVDALIASNFAFGTL